MIAPGPFGGLESVVGTLGGGQSARGHDVRALAIFSSRGEVCDAGPLLRSYGERGIAVRTLIVGARSYLRERARVGEVLRRARPDIVHTHGIRPDIIDAPVAQNLGIPTVATVHGFTGGGWWMRLTETIQTAALRRRDAVAAVSRPLTERLARAGVPRQRIHCIPNAWSRADAEILSPRDARARLSLGEGVHHVGWIGRMSAEKGPDVLGEALHHLRDLPVAVSFVGSGRERAALERGVEAAGMAERVSFHGPVEGAARLYRAFDVIVLSSRTEGTPIVLFEAMAAGVPVVATAVGGVPDVVSDAEARLVPAEDPIALAAAIRDCLEAPAEAASRAAAARRRLERERSADTWLDRYEELYRMAAQGTALARR